MSTDTIELVLDFLPIYLARQLSRRHNDIFYDTISRTSSQNIMRNMFTTNNLKHYAQIFGPDNIDVPIIDTLHRLCRLDNKIFIGAFTRTMTSCILGSTNTMIYAILNGHQYDDHRNCTQLRLQYVKQVISKKDPTDPIDATYSDIIFRLSS